MPSSLIQNSKRGVDLKRLNTAQRSFVLFLLADNFFNPTAAAKAAGYKQPSNAAIRLMRHPLVQAALGKEQREREERCQLKADDVLNYLRAGLFFNPLDLFTPSKDGKWHIQNPDDLPEEVGRLIEKMKVKVIEKDDGTTESYFEVELVSKSTLLPLAMKHLGISGTERVNITAKVGIDFDQLHTPKFFEVDLVQQAIKDASK